MIEPFVNLVIISATGFTVKEHHDSAVRAMHLQFRKHYQPDFPYAEIIYRAWNAPWKSLARRIHQVAIRGCPTIFVGHSWGCGEAFRQFEKEWDRCGRVIDLAFLIDPVPRPFRFLPLRFANVAAMFSRGVFRVDHARSVHTWRQVNALPMGRRVRVPEAHTLESRVYGSPAKVRKRAPRAHPTEIVHNVDVIHTTIDSLPEVLTSIMTHVGSYIDALQEGQ